MFQELLTRLARELTASGIPYMVIGGQAVLLYGEPRLTKDIDITVGVGTDRYEDVRALTGRLDLKVLTENPEEFVTKTMVLPLPQSTRLVYFVKKCGQESRRVTSNPF